MIASLITGVFSVFYMIVYGQAGALFASQPSDCTIDYDALTQKYCPFGIELTKDNYANMSK